MEMDQENNPCNAQMDVLRDQIFSNELIMDEIIGRMDVAGLKVFRLVCRNWYMDSTKFWNKAVCVRFSFREGKACLSDDNPKSLKHFVSCMENHYANVVGGTPCQSFTLENVTNDTFERDGQYLPKFVELCNDNIVHLRLRQLSCNQRQDLAEIVRNIGPHMETLQLVISNPLWGYTTPFQMLEDIYSKPPVHFNLRRLELNVFRGVSRFQFLRRLPNLKELKLSGDVGGYPLELIPTLGTLRCFKKRQHMLALTHLDIIENHHNYNGFVESNLPLKYLAININSQDWQSTTFQQPNRWLQHYGKSLETLKLFRKPTMECQPFPDFPFQATFGNLRILELWGNITTNLDFMLVTPNLRKLRIDFVCFEKSYLVPRSNRNYNIPDVINADIVKLSSRLLAFVGFSLPYLYELVLDSGLATESWISLRDWLPNLTNLEAPLDNETIRVVFAVWKNLRKLKLRFGSDVDDEGITGSAAAEIATGTPNICDLSFLEEFEVQDECGKGNLTDKSAELGFLKLTYLQRLKLSAGNHGITLEMEEKLKQKIKNVEILRGCHNLSQQQPEQYCCRWADHMIKLELGSD